MGVSLATFLSYEKPVSARALHAYIMSPSENGCGYALELGTHLRLGFDVGRPYHHTICAGIEQRADEVLARLLAINRDGDRFRVTAYLAGQPVELLAGLLQIGRRDAIG